MGSCTVEGCMAVLVVSGSVVLVAFQVHKRLLSEFMKKVELELAGRKKCRPKKKVVQFADDVVEPSSNNKEYRDQHSRLMLAKVNRVRVMTNENASNHKNPNQVLEGNMPLNRVALYKQIIEYKVLKGYSIHGCKNRTRIGGIGRHRFPLMLIPKPHLWNRS